MDFKKLAAFTICTSISFSAQGNNPYDIYAQAHKIKPKIANKIIHKNKPFLNDNERKIFMNLAVSEITAGGPDIALNDYIVNNYDLKYPSDYSSKKLQYENTQRGDWVILTGKIAGPPEGDNNQYQVIDKYDNSLVTVEMSKERAFFDNHDIKPGENVDIFCQEHSISDKEISLVKCVGIKQLRKDLYSHMASLYKQYNTFESAIAWYIITGESAKENETVSFYNPAPYIYYAKSMSLNGFECKDDCLEEISAEYKDMVKNGKFEKVIEYMKSNYNSKN